MVNALQRQPGMTVRRILCLPLDGLMLAVGLVLLATGAVLWVLKLMRSYLEPEE